MMTRGRGGVTIPPKIDDVIYEQPLTPLLPLSCSVSESAVIVQFQKYGEKWGRGENVTEWMFRDMVESAGLNTSEDREWIVQATRGDEAEVEEKLVEEEEGGAASPLILRHPRRQSRGHVTFNQQDDIRPISTLLERSRSAKKEKKEREKEERELSDVTEEVMGEMRERKNSAFSWITNSMRRRKKKPKGSEAEVRNQDLRIGKRRIGN